ncbi:MAG TPA: S1C family serine protease [bacterium]|nr:S1C family serine protease [bacterium]
MRAKVRFLWVPLVLLAVLPLTAARLPAQTAPAQPPTPGYTATLDELTQSVVGIAADIPTGARTAPILGTHREGSGVVIDTDGHVVTIGYLILEARSVHLTRYDGRRVPARVAGYDEASGLGLVQAIGPLGLKPLEMGTSSALDVTDPVLVLSRGGAADAHTAHVISRDDFPAYWEYLLERAIFTAPPHGDFAGAALLDQHLRLVGIGSLALETAAPGHPSLPANLFVPIDRLKPVLRDLVETGRPRRAPRPWLGVTLAEQFGRVIVTRVTEDGPAQAAGVQPGDLILEVAGKKVEGLEDFYHKLWALGAAGVVVRLKVLQRSDLMRIDVHSGNRYEHYRLTPRS